MLEQSGQVGDVAVGGSDLDEPRGPCRLRRRRADGEDREGTPSGAKPGEGVDAIAAGEYERRDAVELRRGLRDGPDRQKGRDQRLVAQRTEPGRGLARSGLGARDPDPGGRLQDKTL
jgi:hypothetical protein